MSGFKGQCRSLHRFPSRFGSRCKNSQEYLDELLADALIRLRFKFRDYKRSRKLDPSFKPINASVRSAYNALVWSVKMKMKSKNKTITNTIEEYFALRSELFCTYYELKYRSSVDYSKRFFFDGLDDIELSEVRHYLKKTEVVYKLEVNIPSEFQIQERAIWSDYYKSYISFCLRFDCEHDPKLKWLTDVYCPILLSEKIELIRIFESAETKKIAKEKIDKVRRLRRGR